MPKIESDKPTQEPTDIDKEIESVLNHRHTRAKIELSTRLGRTLDNISYFRLLLLIIFIILACALYFFIATLHENGINVPKNELANDVRLNALYFSVVTFTSLGYGDFSPQGIGKVIASLEVLAGLVLMAILVGKVASERQSTLLLLLSTSDNQRRLRELEENLELSKGDICKALTEQDQVRAAKLAKRGISLVASTRKYLTFQANQAQLTKFGNTSSLRDLYAKLLEFQQMAMDSYKFSVARGGARVSFEKIVKEVHSIAEIMVAFHPEDQEIKKTFLKIGLGTIQFLNLKKSIDSGTTKEFYSQEASEFLLTSILSLLKLTAPDKDTIKVISNKLNISRRMTQRCADELVARGMYKFPIGELEVRRTRLFEKLEEKKLRVKKRRAMLRSMRNNKLLLK